MKSYLSRMAALLVLFAGALPGTSNADDPHKEWIDIQSMSWAQQRPGAATRLADGKYRTAQGQFLIVADGKVAAKGPDYRTYRPGVLPGPNGIDAAAGARAHAQERRASTRSDTPVSASRFVLVVDGMEIAQFSGALGIEAALRTGARSNIVLRRGLLRSPRLREWHESANSGVASTRKGGSIIVYDYAGQEIARYSFRNAWPSKWEGRGSTAGANETAVDSITITVERLEGS